MPYGLFDFEDTIEPMGLSPVAPQYSRGFGFGDDMRIDPNPPIVTKAFPENPPQQLVTMAIPETPPSPTNPLVPSFGLGNDMLENPYTDACIPSEGCNPNPPPMTPPVTLAIPEGGFPPTPPSGQCPTGYQSSNQPDPIRPPSSSNIFHDRGIQYGSGLGGGGGGLPKWNASQMAEVLGSRTPVSATAPNTWSGSQQQYTSMINQLGINTAR
jgi:hypothetical protein